MNAQELVLKLASIITFHKNGHAKFVFDNEDYDKLANFEVKKK
jgi:hypothetical protein